VVVENVEELLKPHSLLLFALNSSKNGGYFQCYFLLIDRLVGMPET